ncbi:MAG: starch-binding protein [Ruminococcus sp.]|nr:starch-binding protein [Ruminococcus sp.]
MKKLFFTFISILLILMTSVSSISLVSATDKKTKDEFTWSEETPFIRYEDSEGIHYKGPVGNFVSTADEYSAEAYSPSESKSPRNTGELASNIIYDNLPQTVDLGSSKYFPPIGNQGGLGSCATFSTTYYQLSYEVNKIRDVQATAENTLSPQIVYNLMSTDNTSGTTAEFNYGFLSVHGAPTMAVLPYSDSDRLSWHPQEAIWKNAMNSRVDELFTIDDIGDENAQVTSADDEDLNEIKYVLSQGHPIVYSAFIYSWVSTKIEAHPDAPENNKYLGEEIVKYQDGFNGSHSMILVGYNDNIWVDLNSNGNVDEGEMGAFKIANSWGEGYANKGFCWVAYDAINKVSSVQGGFAGNRGRIFEGFKWITVKPYSEGAKIYVRFTLNTADRVQMNVDFASECNGIDESNKFLRHSSYRHDGNHLSFDGTKNAIDGTFCYALDNVSPELCAENFNNYNFYATFEDTDADGKKIEVKNVEVVNEHTGKVYKMASEPFSVDGEKRTITLKEAETTDKTVFYIGFDNPTIHYKVGDGEFKKAQMEYTETRLGHNYRFVIEDASDDVTLFFTGEDGRIDDNNGEFFKATERLNFYRTKDARQPLKLNGFEFTNGLPDINKRSYFSYNVTGGYEPYNYNITIENLDTGEVKEYPYDYKYDKSHAFLQEGKHKFSIEVRDQSGDTYLYEEVIDIINRPFVFDELSATSKYGESLFTGENISFYARTDFERIISRGPQKSLYEYVIKDSEGKVCYTETLKSNKYHLGDCVSHIYLDWTPAKKGTYTVTVSSTDDNKTYAEKTTEFTVVDKIYGDANGDGEVNIKDATAIQKCLAGAEQDFVFIGELADCDSNKAVTIKDATCVRKLLANVGNFFEAGKVIEYIPPYTEPETTIATQPQTEPKPVEKNAVTFTNSFNWGGTMSCYYWSDSNKNMTTWPGKAMTKAGTNEFGETYYTFEVPAGATYVIFTNGSSQTVDIPYGGGELKFYPLSETDSQGHYKVSNW